MRPCEFPPTLSRRSSLSPVLNPVLRAEIVLRASALCDFLRNIAHCGALFEAGSRKVCTLPDEIARKVHDKKQSGISLVKCKLKMLGSGYAHYEVGRKAPLRVSPQRLGGNTRRPLVASDFPRH